MTNRDLLISFVFQFTCQSWLIKISEKEHLSTATCQLGPDVFAAQLWLLFSKSDHSNRCKRNMRSLCAACLYRFGWPEVTINESCPSFSVTIFLLGCHGQWSMVNCTNFLRPSQAFVCLCVRFRTANDLQTAPLFCSFHVFPLVCSS